MIKGDSISPGFPEETFLEEKITEGTQGREIAYSNFEEMNKAERQKRQK